MRQMVRAKDNHPFLKKLDALFQYMEDNGISFSLPMSSVYHVEVHDKDSNQTWTLKDIEEDRHLSVTELPPFLEFKLVKEKTEAKVEE